MTRQEKEAQLRTENPTTTDDVGERHGPGSAVYEATIQRWADAMEEQGSAVARESARAAIATQWATFPAWIRDPFGPRYAEAVRLLDLNDIEAAAAIIQYADAPAAYSSEQAEAFELIRAELLAAIELL